MIENRRVKYFPRCIVVGLAVVCTGVAVTGCGYGPTRDPNFAASRPAVPAVSRASPGAIYQTHHNLILFEDQRAREVGDVLTIQLVEETDASKSAETTVSKTQETNVANPTILGRNVDFNLPTGVPLASPNIISLQTNLDSEQDFEGSGESSQSNQINGEITVTVAEVLPNGNLVVQGEKLFSLNRGHEHVRFSGIVRVADVTAENTVESTRVADAQIVYAGQGAVADSNKLGWLARFFLSAFFPL